MRRRNSKSRLERSNHDLLITQTLRRDLDGFVHTARGFIAESDYRRIGEENPAAGLPKYEEIPPLES